MRSIFILAGSVAGLAIAFAFAHFAGIPGLLVFGNPPPVTVGFITVIFVIAALVIAGLAFLTFDHLLRPLYVHLFSGRNGAVRRYCKSCAMHDVPAKLFKPKIVAFLGLVARVTPDRYDKRLGLVG